MNKHTNYKYSIAEYVYVAGCDFGGFNGLMDNNTHISLHISTYRHGSHGILFEVEHDFGTDAMACDLPRLEI